MSDTLARHRSGPLLFRHQWETGSGRERVKKGAIYAVVGQIHFARHSERGKKTRRTKEEVGRQHQGMDRPGVRQVPEGSGEQGEM